MKNREVEAVLKDEQSLNVFLDNMAKFDKQFCDLMVDGVEFTLRLEVRCANGKLIHCRLYKDEIDHNRPKKTNNQYNRRGLRLANP